MSPSAVTPIRRARRAGILAALAALPFAAAYRFALVYRVRAGYPKRHPPAWEPDAVGLAFEAFEIPTSGGVSTPRLVHARRARPRAGRRPDPRLGVVARPDAAPRAGPPRDRDARPHHRRPRARRERAEELPMSVGEYAADTRAAVAALRAPARGDDDRDPRPLDGRGRARSSPRRRTRTSPRSSRSPRPRTPTASPGRRSGSPSSRSRRPRLAARVAHDARLPAAAGHTVASISATHAVRAIRAPVMLVHGTDDGVVPVATSAGSRRARRSARPDAVTETLVVEGGHHSWLYEFPEYRAAIGRFLAGRSAGRSRPTRRPRRGGRARRPAAGPRAARHARRGAGRPAVARPDRPPQRVRGPLDCRVEARRRRPCPAPRPTGADR